jgi:N-acetyl-anhydromuramyl-L-alanine amidase AmpD
LRNLRSKYQISLFNQHRIAIHAEFVAFFNSNFVSAHYLIARDGVVYRLVNEKDIAYHAGKSQLPDGRRSVNSCSIGIELVTSFSEAPTEAQINALVELVKDIKNRYKIKYVLRHSDIAPERKTDPWNMDWENFRIRLNL